MTLNLQSYEPLPDIPPTPPEKRRSPVLAMLLSLIFPGLGHAYLHSWRNAAWIGGFEVLFLLTIVGGKGQAHATALISAPSLYLFAVVDSYFRAREWNAGVTDWLIGANPRVTAILNLLTKGFGYFYLGDRAKGIVCFLVLTVAQALLLQHANIWTEVLAISLQVAVALDGYRVAHDRLLAAHPELRSVPDSEGTVSPNIVDAANPGGFRPPLAITSFAIFGTVMLLAYGASQALNGHVVDSKGTLEQGPDGLIYRNPHEGIELTVPTDWNSLSSEGMLAAFQTNGASLMMEEKFATYAVDSMLNETEKQLVTKNSVAPFTRQTRRFSGKSSSGFETSYKNSQNVLIHQRIFGLRRGLKMLILIESWSGPGDGAIFDPIEQSIRLN